MKLQQLVELIEGKIVTENIDANYEICRGFSSDLMSDVLTILNADALVLLTGLANIQVVRTAEMAGIATIILVRGKKANEDMLAIANENDITIIETQTSLFRSSAILYQAGVESLF
jgi:hypothetical protein